MSFSNRRDLFLIAGLLFVIISLSVYVYERHIDNITFKELTSKHVIIQSDLDGSSYWVLRTNNTQNEKLAADTLARVRIAIVHFIQQLYNRMQETPLEFQKYIQRLVYLFPDGRNLHINELDSSKGNILAINRNKTDGIFLCMRKSRQSMEIADVATLIYIAIHELTHSAIETFEEFDNGVSRHGPEFKLVEKYFYKKARDFGIINPDTIPGTTLCDTLVPRPDQVT